jgi:hypothetical protein
LAEGNVSPVRKIAGQNTWFARTMHDMAYDPVRDEIVVPAFYAYAILSFRGDATGDVAPVRKIYGPHTQLLNPEAVAIDPVHGEIFVPQGERVLVFPSDADGDVAPIRILAGPDTGLGAGRVTVDPVHNLLMASGGGGLRIFDRTASGNTKPRTLIRGAGGLMTTYPPKGLIFARGGSGGGGGRYDTGGYIGVWSIDDSGNAPARWIIGKGALYDIRGVTIDPKSKTVMVSDKTLNAVLSFHAPEVFD